MFDLKIPEGVVTLQDTKIATDPWGFGFTVEALRADHEEHRAWDEAHPESGFSKLHNRAALMQAAGIRDAGTLDDLAAKMDARGDGVLQADQELGKKKVACVTIRSWSGLTRNGVEVPYDKLEALALLGFRGIAWRLLADGVQWVIHTASEYQKLLAGRASHATEAQKILDGKKQSKIIAEVREFHGEHRRDDGSVVAIPYTAMIDGKPKALEYGGNPFGAAMFRWISALSIEASAASLRLRTADTEVFVDSPDTAHVSGDSAASSAPDLPSEPSTESAGATPAE